MRGPGERCWLYYDGAAPVEPGDYIRTPTGRTYLVDSVRVQQKGYHVGRQHMLVTVMPSDHVPEDDAKVHPLYWYRR